MKQTFRLLMLVLPLLLTACINDDSATQGGTTQLVGRWTADVTGATQTLWGDGKALRTTELAIWGHGSGFEANLDVPGKYYTSLDNTTRGVPCSTLPTMPTRWLRRPPTLSSLR